MFTGIVQKLGRIESKRTSADGAAFLVAGLGSGDGVELGDSVAVNGVCQTVEKLEADRIGFTAVGETLKRTTLDTLRIGSAVNLETAATAQTALGGHIVQGHVDGIGTVKSFVRAGKDWILSVRVSKEVLEVIVPKGSVAIDGISLTVIEPKPGGVITMTVVPFTFENTIVGDYRAGSRVNVETDILGKYVLQYISRIYGNRG
ncbi:MAG: riboflavin synthase [Candidatus Latescibacterota bacterium]|nr:MAG: riboflavin synthase [Candidatus Latescibacterota bacterium]